MTVSDARNAGRDLGSGSESESESKESSTSDRLGETGIPVSTTTMFSRVSGVIFDVGRRLGMEWDETGTGLEARVQLSAIHHSSSLAGSTIIASRRSAAV